MEQTYEKGGLSRVHLTAMPILPQTGSQYFQLEARGALQKVKVGRAKQRNNTLLEIIGKIDLVKSEGQRPKVYVMHIMRPCWMWHKTLWLRGKSAFFTKSFSL